MTRCKQTWNSWVHDFANNLRVTRERFDDLTAARRRKSESNYRQTSQSTRTLSTIVYRGLLSMVGWLYEWSLHFGLTAILGTDSSNRSDDRHRVSAASFAEFPRSDAILWKFNEPRTRSCAKSPSFRSRKTRMADEFRSPDLYCNEKERDKERQREKETKKTRKKEKSVSIRRFPMISNNRDAITIDCSIANSCKLQSWVCVTVSSNIDDYISVKRTSLKSVFGKWSMRNRNFVSPLFVFNEFPTSFPWKDQCFISHRMKTARSKVFWDSLHY